MVEMESVEIVKDPRKSLSTNGLRLHISCFFGRDENNGDHSSPVDTAEVPSLDRSIATSSSSSGAYSMERGDQKKAGGSMVNNPQSIGDEGCVTDRVVRFFCPFEEPCLASDDLKQSHLKPSKDSLVACSDFGAHSNGESCSGTSWVQLCIPDKWEDSPERDRQVVENKQIRNRCCALEPTKRKSDYIMTIRSQWHSPDTPIPLRSSRSETATKTWSIQATERVSNESVFYDSDPGYAEIPRFKKNRPAALALETEEDRNVEYQHPQAPRHSSRKTKSFFSSPRSVTEVPDVHNDDEAKAFIQLASEQKYDLIWHQPPCRTEGGLIIQAMQPPPISVTGWFEYGSQLDNHVVFPKFVWRQTIRSSYKDIARVPVSVQLLSIVCVVAPTTLDRALYPYARLDLCCFIRTHDGLEYVFEASSRQDRDLFVKRMKILVARLASSVIVNSEAMLLEFFAPLGTVSFADLGDDMSLDCQNIGKDEEPQMQKSC